ncbi:MAG: hypothetical protein AB7T37_07730 [Dehalococcoidia bacterium]
MALLRGALVSFDAGSYRAAVRVDGSVATTLSDIPVAANIPAVEMVSGRQVLVDSGATGDVGEMVVYAVVP